MVNLKDLFERMDRNYTLSTVRGTLNYYDYWLRQGYSQKHAMDNAIKYAMGQVRSIITPDGLQKSVRNFELMGQISQTVASLLQNELNKKTRMGQSGGA